MLKKNLSLFLQVLLANLCLISMSVAAGIVPILHHAGDPTVGNAQGDVTVMEFFDYQCSHCSNMAPVMASVIKANPNVRFVFKDLPIKGAISEYGARVALAANKQNKYYVVNHSLLTTNLSLTKNTILDIAKSLNIDMKRLQKDMLHPSIGKEIANNYTVARELGIRGTPGFLIAKTNEKKAENVRVVLGEMSQSELQQAIDSAGK